MAKRIYRMIVLVSIFLGIGLGDSSKAQEKRPAYLAFLSNRDAQMPQDFDLYVMDLNDQVVQRLTDNAKLSPYESPVWSWDGAWLYMVAQPHDAAHYGLYRVAREGGNLQALTPPEIAVIPNSSIALAPDGEHLLFVVEADTTLIYQMRVDGSELKPYIESSYAAFAPRWSPDGAWVAYIDWPLEAIEAGKHGNLLIRALADGKTRLIAESFLFSSELEWSPDGQSLLFSAQDAHLPQDLWRVSLEGELVRLTDTAAYEGEAQWSVDGRQIAFSSDQSGEGHKDIYLMQADARHIERLTSSPSHDFSPLWLDDTQLIYVSSKAGDFNILGLDLETGISSIFVPDSGKDEWHPALWMARD